MDISNGLLQQWLHIKSSTAKTWMQINYPITTHALAIYGSYEGGTTYAHNNAESYCFYIYDSNSYFKYTKTNENYLWVFVIGF